MFCDVAGISKHCKRSRNQFWIQFCMVGSEFGVVSVVFAIRSVRVCVGVFCCIFAFNR